MSGSSVIWQLALCTGSVFGALSVAPPCFVIGRNCAEGLALSFFALTFGDARPVLQDAMIFVVSIFGQALGVLGIVAAHATPTEAVKSSMRT